MPGDLGLGPGDNLERAPPRGVVEDAGGDHDLIGAGRAMKLAKFAPTVSGPPTMASASGPSRRASMSSAGGRSGPGWPARRAMKD
jgi:hypothetical protein